MDTEREKSQKKRRTKNVSSWGKRCPVHLVQAWTAATKMFWMSKYYRVQNNPTLYISLIILTFLSQHLTVFFSSHAIRHLALCLPLLLNSSHIRNNWDSTSPPPLRGVPLSQELSPKAVNPSLHPSSVHLTVSKAQELVLKRPLQLCSHKQLPDIKDKRVPHQRRGGCKGRPRRRRRTLQATPGHSQVTRIWKLWSFGRYSLDPDRADPKYPWFGDSTWTT